MRDDDKPGPNLSIPTIPSFMEETDEPEAETRIDRPSADLRERIAEHEATEQSLNAPTVPSFIPPGLPPEDNGIEAKPGPILVDDLIADSLRAAVIRPRAPTLSSILGPPIVPQERPERSSLSSLPGLTDQIPPSLRDASAPTASSPDEAKRRRSGTLFLIVLVVAALIGAGAVTAVVFRSGFP